jgi:predicted DNA-binding antitoxin AbrB/MazE fold protein
MHMVQNVEAIYEHGAQRPLEPLSLTESQRVRISISSDGSGHSRRDVSTLNRARSEAQAAGRVPTIEEVRAALESISGSLSQEVVAERGEY